MFIEKATNGGKVRCQKSPRYTYAKKGWIQRIL